MPDSLAVRYWQHPHDPSVWVVDYLGPNGTVTGTTNRAIKPAAAVPGSVVTVHRPIHA